MTAKFCGGTCRQQANWAKVKAPDPEGYKLPIGLTSKELESAIDRAIDRLPPLKGEKPKRELLKVFLERKLTFADDFEARKLREQLEQAIPASELAEALRESPNSPRAALLNRTRGLVKWMDRRGGQWKVAYESKYGQLRDKLALELDQVLGEQVLLSEEYRGQCPGAAAERETASHQ